MDAWLELKNNNYRKSVLDAATAVELALNKVLRDKSPVDGNYTNEFLKDYNSLSKKRKLCEFLKIDLPDYKYDKEFEGLRNRAIHAGTVPTEKESKKALEIANEVLNKIIPNKFEMQT